jgi:hypothetical protein
MLYDFTTNVILYHVKMTMFYNDKTTNVTFVGQKIRYPVHS